MNAKRFFFAGCLLLCAVVWGGCQAIPRETPPPGRETAPAGTPVPQTALPASPRPVPTVPPSPSADPIPPPTPPPAVRFETPMGDSADNRRGNIALVAQKLTGAVVKPGETFSFNHTVGARTVKAGYREAPIIVDGEKKKGIGGGVCQVSTTLYNAALEAGFEIVERHEHTKDVAYVPDGKDAAVSYGSWDLRFRNTTASAYVIRCEVTQTRVTVVLTPQGE